MMPFAEAAGTWNSPDLWYVYLFPIVLVSIVLLLIRAITILASGSSEDSQEHTS